MTPTSLAAAAAPRTGKINKNDRQNVFERRENLLQNGILHLPFILLFIHK